MLSLAQPMYMMSGEKFRNQITGRYLHQRIRATMHIKMLSEISHRGSQLHYVVVTKIENWIERDVRRGLMLPYRLNITLPARRLR